MSINVAPSRARRVAVIAVVFAAVPLAAPAFAAVPLAAPTGQQATSPTTAAPTTAAPPTAKPTASKPTATIASVSGPSPDQGGGVIPRPNSGVKPQASGDRGGWGQLLLWALLSSGLAVVGIRIAWGIRKHNLAHPTP